MGTDAYALGHHLSFRYPIDHGHVVDWVDVSESVLLQRLCFIPVCATLFQLEDMWNYIFKTGLKVDPADHPVLLSEPPFSSTLHRERLVEDMVEKFDVAEVNLSIQGILTLYS